MSNALNFFSVFIGCIEFTLSKGDGNQQNWPRNQQGWNSGGGQMKGGPLGGWDDEPSNPWGGGGGGWKLEDSIPGIPGQSYPNFDKIPDTSFDCRRQKNPGYYGDVESQCQVFHICQAGGRQNSFLCPVGTIFNQENFVCDWWFNVNCGESPVHYDRNGNLFRGSDIGIDGSKIKRKGQQGNSKGSDQTPAVGIPTWSPQGADGNWGMKGSMNQGGQQGSWGNQGGSNKGATSGQRRPNANAGGRGGRNKGAARGNSGRNNWQNGGSQGGQKGSGMGGNTNTGWGQQGNSPGRNKGIVNNQMRQNRGGNFVQKGDFSGGNNKIQRRSGLSPNNRIGRGDQKGQVNTNTIPGNKEGKGNFGMGNKGLIGNQGGSKGSDGRTDKNPNTNGWSMGQQNFQFSFHEKSEAFSGNSNTENGPSFQDNSWQGPGVNENFQPDRNFKGEYGNSNWNNAGGALNQWGNRIGEFQPEFVNNNADGHDNWKADYDVPNANSFHLNDKGSFEGQAGENDYDYAWNS
ncbi:chitin-binding type-2 domain-containing protein [Caerostris darwini]|uniref:Chitin-binding type-2 domain-containing protein n=1 Tax=Caerostris darwini TaxID=1538125 RepID=A0AAV4S9P9_9ARAC|nr:chitin-binding type-2 domain-containing protein [Caerostris darwini]